MPKRFPEEQRLHWKQHVLQQQESGQSIHQWCREHNLNYDSFLYWKKQFSPTKTVPLDRSSFRELKDPPPAAGITLEYHTVKIHLPKNFDPTTLKECLHVLKGALC